MRNSRPKPKKKPTNSQLKKKLDSVFSRFIRIRDKGRCISCGTVQDWKEMDCGHYVSRSHMSTRFDEKNCNCQCKRCNIFMAGNYPAYSAALIAKYGHGIIEELVKKGKSIVRYGVKDYEELIERYQKKIEKL